MPELYTNSNCDQLAQKAKSRPFDIKTVVSFFAMYDKTQEHSIQNRITYLQLKYLKEKQKSRYLNELALIYLEQNKKFIAFVCLIQSLFLNPCQQDIFTLADSIADDIAPQFPAELKKDRCKISVIMPTYNRIVEIREAIYSVLNQNFKDFELIVINNGGTDEVKDIIDSFKSPKIKYYKLEEKQGLSRALNEGISRAEGEYIAYLDDDDIYYPNHLEILVRSLDRTDYKFVYTNTQAIKGVLENGRFKKICTQFKWQKSFAKDKLLLDNFISVLSIMHHKDIFKEVGLFRDELHLVMDWEFWVRCSLKFNFLHINKFTGEYRIKHNNMVVKNLAEVIFLLYLIKNYYSFYQGKIAYIKYYLNSNQKQDAYDIYKTIVSCYAKYFKIQFATRELIFLARRFNDNRFLKRLLRDYLYFASRACLKGIIDKARTFRNSL